MPWGALATACATPSTSSRSHWRLSRRLSARPYTRSCPPCGCGHDSARACGCLRSGKGDAALRTALPPWLERPTTHVCGTGVRTRRQAVVLAAPQMPATSTLLDQAYNAIARQWFAMPGCHHLGGSQQAFLIGLAHLYNLLPSQRRTQCAGRCSVEVEGGRVPTCDWFLNFQILTSGGLR